MNMNKGEWIKGDIVIPDDKKDGLNKIVLSLLNRGGIRKIEEITIAGRSVEVACKVSKDEQGIVKFNYDSLHDTIWEIGTYDTNTFQLDVHDYGDYEYNWVIDIIKCVLCTYSVGSSVLMNGDDIFKHERLFLEIALSIQGKESMINFYKVLDRENQDEFLELWENDNLVLSDYLKEQMIKWSNDIKNAFDIGEECVEGYLADILAELEEDEQVKCTEKDFVELILANKDKEDYRKALYVLRGIMDREINYFPELTRHQAFEWVLKGRRSKRDGIMIGAYQSLMINGEKRREILGI
jgi:hypothetical protein